MGHVSTMFEEIEEIGEIRIDRYGCISIRTDCFIMKDGVEIAKNYHRKTINPGSDVKDEDNVIQAIAHIMWSKDLIVKWHKRQRQLENELRDD